MARIKLVLPEKKLGTITIPVRITDLNYGSHVGNDSFVSLLHEARAQWLQQHGFTELNAGGVSLIMGDLAIEFKKECFYPDVLKIEISVAEICASSFELYYAAKNQQEDFVLLAKTGMICYDYMGKKVSRLTTELRAILE